MQNLHRFSLLAVFVFSFCLSLSAWANDAYKQWQQQQQAEFDQYLTEQQKAFVGFLKANWIEKEQEKAVSKDIGPKPVVLPKVDVAPVLPKLPDVKPIAQLPKSPPKAEPEPIIAKPHAAKAGIRLVFYGHDLVLAKITPAKKLVLKRNNDSLADNWLRLSRAESTKTFITQLEIVKSQLRLSDWAVYQLLNDYAQALGLGRDGQTFLVWTLLTQQGYDARIAYDKKALYLLLPSQQQVFATTYIQLSGKKFYFIGAQEAPVVHVYEGSNLDKDLDFSFDKTVLVNAADEKPFQLQDVNTGLKVEYNLDDKLSAYYLSHPQLDLAWYFRAKINSRTELQLVEQFKRLLSGLTDIEKVQILLSFVQFAYEYELDDKQWGGEYYAAPDHMLALRAADCEDRSFLFARLVKEVIGLDAVGLLFPGHVAVAVNFADKQPEGVFYMHNKKRFYITDPTYIGAAIGAVMPDFVSTRPTVIEI